MHYSARSEATGLIDITLHAFLSENPLAGLAIGALVAAALVVTRTATRRSRLTARSGRSRI